MLLALAVLSTGHSQPKEPGDTKTIMLPGDVPLEMVWIPPGSFMMGNPENEQDRWDRERPQHEVSIAEGFWMGKYPVTQVQWEAVMGDNPSYFSGGNRPVERVLWNVIRGSDGFLDQLNALRSGYNFRLPSEAEWEYAVRAGTTTRFYWGDDPDLTKIGDHAWYMDNSDLGNGRQTHPVGQKSPNAWGLYDMAGNVYEWCEDDWHSNYDGAPEDGSARVKESRGWRRVMRGGSYYHNADWCRSAARYHPQPGHPNNAHGFRVVMTP